MLQVSAIGHQQVQKNYPLPKMNNQLSDSIHQEIQALCKTGDLLMADKDLAGARERFIAALKLLPGEPNEWEAATWIYVAIGDTHF